MSKPRTIADYPNRADDYESAAEKAHDQNTDIALDEGGDNEVSAEQLRTHIDSTENPHNVTAGQVGAYTKGETDDLLDDKADQSDLNATNQAVAGLDDRVGTAEDNIQGLEEGKADRYPSMLVKDIGLITGVGDTDFVILLAPRSASGRQEVIGDFYMMSEQNNNRSVMHLEVAYRNPNNLAGSLTYELKANRGPLIDVKSCVYSHNSVNYDAIAIFRPAGVGQWLPSWVRFSGSVVGGATLGWAEYNETNVVSETLSGVSRRYIEAGRTYHTGDYSVYGNVTATDFITTSRVESDRKGALSALNNMSEWKKKDGTIDYKKHYAYTPQFVRDEKGKVIEEKPGLSMEKRVAMLEKMVAELHSKNTDLTQKLANINKRQ